MAGVPDVKRARVEEVREDGDDHDESEEESEEDDEEMVAENEIILKDTFEFAVRKPESVDYGGIRQLLGQMFLKLQVNISKMTDWIIIHNNVGSFLHQCFPELDEEDANGEGKVNGEDDMDDDSNDGQFPVLNIVTVINIAEKPDLEFTSLLRKLLLDRCKSNCRDEFQGILSNPENRIGLLINERYVNMPPQLCLMENLWTEIEEAKQVDDDYKFSHYLVISKVDRLTKQSKRKQKAASQPERLFRNFEEEIFYKNALLSFEFSVKDQSDSALCSGWNDDGGPYEPFRTVMIVAADKIPTIMSEMTAFIAENGIEQGTKN